MTRDKQQNKIFRLLHSFNSDSRTVKKPQISCKHAYMMSTADTFHSYNQRIIKQTNKNTGIATILKVMSMISYYFYTFCSICPPFHSQNPTTKWKVLSPDDDVY